MCRVGSRPDCTQLQSAVSDRQLDDGQSEDRNLWSRCVCVCVCLKSILVSFPFLLYVCMCVFVLREVQRAAGGLSEWHKAHGQVIEVIKVGQEWRKRRRRRWGRGGGADPQMNKRGVRPQMK